MRQQARGPVARIARVAGRRRVDRVGVEAPLCVEHADQADPAAEGAVAGDQQAVEAVIEPTPQRAIGLVGGPALPAVPAVLGHDVDEARQRLPVPGREGVGDQRRFRENVGRDAQPERAGGRVKLVFDAEPVQDEGLFPDAPATVAVADGTRRQLHRLLQGRNGQVPDLFGGDALHVHRREWIEHAVGCRLDQDGVDAQGVRLQLDVQRDRLAAAHQDAVVDDRAEADRRDLHPVPAAADLPHPERARGVRAGAGAPAIHRDHRAADAAPAHGIAHPATDRPARLGSERRRGGEQQQ